MIFGDDYTTSLELEIFKLKKDISLYRDAILNSTFPPEELKDADAQTLCNLLEQKDKSYDKIAIELAELKRALNIYV